MNKFFQKLFIEKNDIERKPQEILSRIKREVKGISFIQNQDEIIVMEFLNNMDKRFDSNTVGWKQQGEYFEKFLSSVFRLAGYEVEISKKRYIKNNSVVYTGDKGIDLVLRKDQECIAVQAKHYRLNTKAPKLIDIDHITKYSGISDSKWTNKLFITTSLFNPHVYIEIERNEKAQKIEWYDRYGLLQLLNKLIPKTMEKHMFLNSLPISVSKCPDCDMGFIIPKWSKSGGYFRGCTNFPECVYTEKSF